MTRADNQATLAGLLRLAGAATIVAALCAHMLIDWEGWQAWADASRYYAIAAGAVVFALLGIGVSRVGNEQKSARLFLGLTLAFVVAAATTLGGLLHDLLALDIAHPGLSWTVIGASALLVLVPVSWFAFRVLTRPNARELCALFAVLNLLLLIPLRDSPVIAGLIAVATFVPALYLHRRYQTTTSYHLRTKGGHFAAAMLFAPAIIMLARTFVLYEADLTMLWMLATIVFVLSRYACKLVDGQSPVQFVIGVVSVGAATALSWLTAKLLHPYLPEEALLPLFGVVSSALVASMGWQHRNARSRFLAAGAVIMTLSLLPSLIDLVLLIDFSNWLTLAITGTLVILMSAYIERRRSTDAEAEA